MQFSRGFICLCNWADKMWKGHVNDNWQRALIPKSTIPILNKWYRSCWLVAPYFLQFDMKYHSYAFGHLTIFSISFVWLCTLDEISILLKQVAAPVRGSGLGSQWYLSDEHSGHFSAVGPTNFCDCVCRVAEKISRWWDTKAIQGKSVGFIRVSLRAWRRKSVFLGQFAKKRAP